MHLHSTLRLLDKMSAVVSIEATALEWEQSAVADSESDQDDDRPPPYTAQRITVMRTTCIQLL